MTYPTQAEVEAKIAEHHALLLEWAEGRRSWVNLGPFAPYTPDVIARIDAAEVEKHAAAIRGLTALLNQMLSEVRA